MTVFTDLAQALSWLFDLQKFGVKFGLSSTLDLLARLGLSFQEGRYLHIAGTNGKGSVAAILSAVLTRAGYPVGLFTSPHLVSFQERLRLRDREITADRLLALINRVRTWSTKRSLPPSSNSPPAWPFSISWRKRRTPSSWKPAWGRRRRHQHRTAAPVGDHQHLPGPSGLPGAPVGYRRREGGHHQRKDALNYLCPATIGSGTLPPPLPGTGGAAVSGGSGLQDSGDSRGALWLPGDEPGHGGSHLEPADATSTTMPRCPWRSWSF